jgi:hypothetical protein
MPAAAASVPPWRRAVTITSCAVCGISRDRINAALAGVKGMSTSASGRHQQPRSTRITRTS